MEGQPNKILTLIKSMQSHEFINSSLKYIHYEYYLITMYCIVYSWSDFTMSTINLLSSTYSGNFKLTTWPNRTTESNRTKSKRIESTRIEPEFGFLTEKSPKKKVWFDLDSDRIRFEFGIGLELLSNYIGFGSVVNSKFPHNVYLKVLDINIKD